MRFAKELLVCLVIILAIIGFDVLFEKHFGEKKNEIENIINELQDIISKDEDGKNKSEELYQKWFEFEAKSSYYVEHDELEKVSLKVCLVKKSIEIEEKEDAIEYLEEIKFLLDHVFEKDKLRLKNIF